MKPEDFADDAPGRLVWIDGPTSRFCAYVPDPLPGSLDLEQDTFHTIVEAHEALGELNGIGRLPNPHLLIRPFMRREAVSSSRIEGTITNLEQLLLFEVDPEGGEQREDRQEVYNYVRALTYGLERLSSLPTSLRLIREVHGILLEGVRGHDQTPGEFRRRQNMLGRVGQTPDEARFVPPPVPEMTENLYDLEKYIFKIKKVPLVTQLALIHYQFETIHPFLDGNGRIGRLLISLLLHERNCLRRPGLYLSSYFEIYKSDYVDKMLAVSQKGDWNDWVKFFAEAVSVQSRLAASKCDQFLSLWERYREVVQQASSSSNTLRLIDLLFDLPAITIRGVSEKLGLSFVAAQKNIEKLEQIGILEEVTGLSRNRVYLAREIIGILEGPEDRAPSIVPTSDGHDE